MAHFAQNWQKVTNNKWVLSLVKTGYRIPFIERPPLSVDPIFFQQSLSPQLEEEVASLLQKGAVEEIHPVSLGFYSRIFLVPKKNGKVRLIIDLSTLNRHVFIQSSKMETLLEHRHYIMYLITSLGLIINYQKSDLIPTQIFTFIGMEFLTFSNIVRVPHPRVQKLLETIRIIYQKTFISARVFISLLGQISAAADFVMLGRLHLRPIQVFLLSQWRPQKFSLNHQIKISANILHHLDWWKQEEIYQQGVPLRINPPSHTIFTDASLSGWGSHVEPEGLLFHGVWTETQSQLHINMLEMMAISMALKEALHTIKNSTVLVSTDNTTVVAYLRSSKCSTSHDSVSQHRLVCDTSESQASAIRVSNTRSKGPINSCSIDELESHSRLRFSSISSHSCIDQQNMSVSVQNSIDSSFLTQQIMVPRTSGSAGVSTNNPPCNSKSIRTITRKVQASKHRYAAASRLGIISNQSEIKKISEQVADHVSKARRKSTG